jgi:hypothetical protein
MLHRSLRSFIFLMVLLSLNFQKILPNLLPGTVVQIGRNEYSYVENLQKGQLVVTQHEELPGEFHRTKIFEILKRENHTDRAVLVELKPKNGESGLLMVGEGQYFHRQNAAAKLKPKLLKHVKQGKKKALKVLLNALWVKAEDLKVGDKLIGKNGKSLYVTRVELVELNEKLDSYEISLKHHHLYYLVDTAGNHVLTHNFIVSILLSVAIGFASGGAGTAGGLLVYKKLKGEVVTNGELADAALKGAYVGAAIGVFVAIGMNWAAIKGCSLEYIKNHESVAKAYNYCREGCQWGKDICEMGLKNKKKVVVESASAATVVGGTIWLKSVKKNEENKGEALQR